MNDKDTWVCRFTPDLTHQSPPSPVHYGEGYLIVYGYGPNDWTESCAAHLGWMIPDGGCTVNRLAEPDELLDPPIMDGLCAVCDEPIKWTVADGWQHPDAEYDHAAVPATGHSAVLRGSTVVRCTALAKVGTGVGACNRVLDSYGHCDGTGGHLS